MEMPEKVKTRRKYYSPLRADQAEQTRRRILEAGFRLFVDRGYAGTTIAAVAEEAGVSPRRSISPSAASAVRSRA
jgi:AcrR family transcriptional regulator